jgi:hypothetical protein
MQIRLLALLAFLPGLLGAGAATLPPQKLLPANTLLLVTMPDSTNGWRFVTNSSMARLWRDPAMKAFTDKFADRLNTAVLAPLEQQLGVHFADYQGLARGQMTLALVPFTHPDDPANADAAGGNATVFLLDSGDHSAQLATNLAALKKKWTDAGNSLKSEKIRDLDFATLFTSSDALSLRKLLPGLVDTNDSDDLLPKPAPDKIQLTFGQSGSLLLVSQSREVIEKILVRQAGGLLPALDEQPAFQSDFAARLHDTPLYAWVNIKAFLSNLEKQQAPQSGNSAAGPLASDGTMSALGFTGLTSASVACRSTSDGLSVDFFVGAPESTRRGLLKILATEAKNSGPPPFVPADAVKFSRVRLDLPSSWKAFESTLNQINPQYAQMLNYVFGLAGKDKDEKYDLKAELLGSLGDDIITYQRNPVLNTLDGLQQAPDIYLIGSPDPEKLAASLKVILSLAAQAIQGTDAIKDREFLGRKIYSLTLPVSPQGGSHSYHFAASGGYLALTGNVEMLEEYLRGSDSNGGGLDKTPGLNDAAQKGGGLETGIFAFSNDKADMRAIVETLRKEQLSLSDFLGLFGVQLSNANLSLTSELSPPKISTVEEAGQFKKWADFSLLPPTDVLTKYFNFSVWVGGFTPEGFSIKCFTPTPPALR